MLEGNVQRLRASVHASKGFDDALFSQSHLLTTLKGSQLQAQRRRCGYTSLWRLFLETGTAGLTDHALQVQGDLTRLLLGAEAFLWCSVTQTKRLQALGGLLVIDDGASLNLASAIDLTFFASAAFDALCKC